MQMAFIYFGGDTFRATPLALSDILCVILICFSIVEFDFIRKLLYKRRKIRKERKRVKKQVI